jgi:hypothetical protein
VTAPHPTADVASATTLLLLDVLPPVLLAAECLPPHPTVGVAMAATLLPADAFSPLFLAAG